MKTTAHTLSISIGTQITVDSDQTYHIDQTRMMTEIFKESHAYAELGRYIMSAISLSATLPNPYLRQKELVLKEDNAPESNLRESKKYSRRRVIGHLLNIMVLKYIHTMVSIMCLLNKFSRYYGTNPDTRHIKHVTPTPTVLRTYKKNKTDLSNKELLTVKVSCLLAARKYLAFDLPSLIVLHPILFN